MRHIETQQRFVASLHNEDGDGLPGDPLLLKRERQRVFTQSPFTAPSLFCLWLAHVGGSFFLGRRSLRRKSGLTVEASWQV